MRPIDADAFDVISTKAPDGVDADSYIAGIAYVVSKIDAQPTIEERKTGKWIQVHGFVTPGGDPVWCCSECGKGVHVYGIEHGTYGADISDGQWKACPNCSALMEGEQP